MPDYYVYIQLNVYRCNDDALFVVCMFVCMCLMLDDDKVVRATCVTSVENVDAVTVIKTNGRIKAPLKPLMKDVSALLSA